MASNVRIAQSLAKARVAGHQNAALNLSQIATIVYVERSYFFAGVEDSADYEEPMDDERRRDAMEVVKDYDPNR